jgi:O-glycosyl hydrolase
MKTKLFLTAAIALALAFVVTGCDSPVNEKNDINKDPTAGKAPSPNITVHPTSYDYLATDTIALLTVTATVQTGGTLTYQWYSNTSYSNAGGTAIEGETSTSFLPSSTPEAFYFAKVTNTAVVDDSEVSTTVASNPARIRVLTAAPAAPSKSLTVNTADERQFVRGFGGMSNVWAAPDVTVRDIETMCNPVTGLGLNILRICLYPYMDDIISNTENPDRDNSDWYELVKRVNRYNGYVLASPWTPPAEWKSNNSRVGGGKLVPAYYTQYAQHLKEFCQRMSDNGAPIYAVSIQNEPDYVADYDGCEWDPADEVSFFTTQGHFTDGVPGYGGGQPTSSVKIMTAEVANTVTWNNPAMADAAASNVIDLVGYHIYGNVLGSRYAQALDNTTKPKETWMTEHNINTPANYLLDSTWGKVWDFIDEVHHVIAVNDSSAFIWWYAKRFYSFIGDGDYDTVNGKPLWRGWALSHYAKYAAGTTRVTLSASGISSFTAGTVGQNSVMGSAYKTTDSVRLVIYNKGSSAVGDIKIDLPAAFTANNVSAVITDGATEMGPHLITLGQDKHSAVFELPASSIISVKFTN